jgi:predicted RNA-binding protein
MCELNVVLNGEIIFKDAIYAKADGSKVIIKNMLGDSKEFENCKIVEVNINSVSLILSHIEDSLQ